MKKLIVMILASVMVFSLAACGGEGSMKLDNGEDGIIKVTAENAGKKSEGVGYITIAEGECLVISPVLEKGAYQVTVRDGADKVILDESVEGKVMQAYPLDAGDYSLLITCTKTASGTMQIMPYSIEQLEKENASLAKALQEAAS